MKYLKSYRSIIGSLVLTLMLMQSKLALALGDLSSKLSGLNPLPWNSLEEIIDNIPRILVGIGTIIFVVMLLINGYRYMISMGNEEVSKKAKQGLTWALAGLIAVYIGYAFIMWIKGKLPIG